MAKKILIVGAGVSGLCAAYALKRKGFEVVVLESKSRAGGVINTFNESGFRAESGSNSVMVQSKKTLDFIEELGLSPRIANSSQVSKKRFFVKNNIFEDLGLIYLGPVDGNDEAAVERLLREAKNADQSCVIHIKTKKGKGYKFAEDKPTDFHGVGAFEVETGESGKGGEKHRIAKPSRQTSRLFGQKTRT